MDAILSEFEIWLTLVGLGSGSWIGYVVVDGVYEKLLTLAERRRAAEQDSQLPTMPPPQPAAPFDDSSFDSLAAGIVERYLEIWEHGDEGRDLATALHAALAAQQPPTTLQQAIEHQLRQGIAPLLDDEDGALRAQLIGAQLLGAAVMRHVVRAEPLASLPAPQLVEALTPAVGRSLAEAFAAVDAQRQTSRPSVT
ncbi:TetR/AcrR family transcriptional regulator [Rubrivivax gelatinosus]|uniref:TetR/AcrR family transcriptional regulator n=1 Tax=Rubrivivax gelatinosus TaxID=28068 RepID=UPI0002F9C347|nr:hypothetical protein [Rubrivivax gelatinosus]MBG6080542.1 hypothetical protein [Rubrivivax gelatinosus]